MIKRIGQIISQILFRTRRNCDTIIRKAALKCSNKKILEIGSGKKVDGKYIYSYKEYFNDTNNFIRSDINPDYGHKIIDVTTTKIRNEFDIIICLNVLEHIYEYQKAVDNLFIALKKGGQLICFTPYIYPLHDLPHDYFRFSEFALKEMFREFTKTDITHFGIKRFPSGYYIKAMK